MGVRASLGWPLLLLAACIGPTGSGGEPSAGTGSATSGGSGARDAPRFISASENGQQLRLRVGQSAELVLAADVPDPQLDGDTDALLLIEIVAIDAMSGRRWELRAQRPGRCRLSVAGARPFVIYLEVAEEGVPPR